MIAVINGPNLNLLGHREPEIYGKTDFLDFLKTLREKYPYETIEYFQSNSEGEIIDQIQKFGFDSACKGIILNPGGYTHYSVAIADAVAAVPATVIEVHISNIHAREEFRHQSVTARAAKALIAGLGLHGYTLAVDYLSKLSK